MARTSRQVADTQEQDVKGTGAAQDIGLLKEQILDLKKQLLAITTASTEIREITELLKDHTEVLDSLTKTVSVLRHYVQTFNSFLGNSMISNNADKAAEDALTEVLNGLST